MIQQQPSQQPGSMTMRMLKPREMTTQIQAKRRVSPKRLDQYTKSTEHDLETKSYSKEMQLYIEEKLEK